MKLTIRAKICLLCAVYSLAGVATTLGLVARAAMASDHYSVVVEGQVHSVDLTRQMQLAFKRQVQEWKDVLLRGSDPQALVKYRDGFFAQEKQVTFATLVWIALFVAAFLARDTQTAAAELARMAAQLQNLVAQFKLDQPAAPEQTAESKPRAALRIVSRRVA
jgi:hypothetical protein